MKCLKIDKEWTLFLDRDGVINKRIIGDYIKKPEEFVFLEGVTDAISALTRVFKYIFIVTNQQGVGKGLMTVEELSAIHSVMMHGIQKSGGKIDKIYFCKDLSGSGSLYRKPEIGMALQAKKEFPEVDLKKSIMVGDTKNDLLFGSKAGMKRVFVSDNLDEIREYADLFDISVPGLKFLPERLSIAGHEKQ